MPRLALSPRLEAAKSAGFGQGRQDLGRQRPRRGGSLRSPPRSRAPPVADSPPAPPIWPRQRPKFAGTPTYRPNRGRFGGKRTPKRRLALSPFLFSCRKALQPLLDGGPDPRKLPHDLPHSLTAQAILGPDVGLGGPERAPGGYLDVAGPEVLGAAVPALHGPPGLRHRRRVQPPGPPPIPGSGSARTIQEDRGRLLPDQHRHNAGAPIAGRCVRAERGPAPVSSPAGLPRGCL